LNLDKKNKCIINNIGRGVENIGERREGRERERERERVYLENTFLRISTNS